VSVPLPYVQKNSDKQTRIVVPNSESEIHSLQAGIKRGRAQESAYASLVAMFRPTNTCVSRVIQGDSMWNSLV